MVSDKVATLKKAGTYGVLAVVIGVFGTVLHGETDPAR